MNNGNSKFLHSMIGNTLGRVISAVIIGTGAALISMWIEVKNNVTKTQFEEITSEIQTRVSELDTRVRIMESSRGDLGERLDRMENKIDALYQLILEEGAPRSSVRFK